MDNSKFYGGTQLEPLAYFASFARLQSKGNALDKLF